MNSVNLRNIKTQTQTLQKSELPISAIPTCEFEIIDQHNLLTCAIMLQYYQIKQNGHKVYTERSLEINKYNAINYG